MADEKQILQNLGLYDFAEMAAETDDFVARSMNAVAAQSNSTMPYVDFSALQAASLAERNLSPTDRMLIDVDDIYRKTGRYPSDPNDHPDFVAERQNKISNAQGVIRSTLTDALQTQPLPAKGEEGFTILERGLKELSAINKEAQKQGRTFGQIWLDKVDQSKMSYVEQTRYAMEARQYELMLNNKMNPQQAFAQVQKEFEETFNKLQEDPVYAQLMMMTPEQRSKEFAKSFNESMAYATQTNRFEALDPEELKRYQTHFGILTDVVSGFVPYVGVGTALYMAGTGDDIFINAFSGEDYKLRWWERGLMALPVAGPLFRAIKHPVRYAKDAGKTTMKVADLVKKYMGEDVKNLVVGGGPNKLRGALKHIQEMGHHNEIDDILLDIKRGVVQVSDEEQTLVNILRSVAEKNSGTARAMLRAGSPAESPLIRLAKHAIASGDETARKEITNLILNVGENVGSERAKALMKVLDVDSDGMTLILRDMRSVRRADDVASGAEKSILDARRQIEIKKARLENLKKAREASAAARTAKAATVAEQKKVAAEVADRAEQAPLLEEHVVGDSVKVEDAPVNNTVKTPTGEDVRVVAQTPESTIIVKADGSFDEIVKGLSVDQRAHIMSRVRELGSMDAVKALYYEDSAVSLFARRAAADLYKDVDELSAIAQKAAPKAAVQGKPQRVKRSRAEFNTVSDLLLRNADDAEAAERLDKLIARLEDDIAKFPDQAGTNARLDILNDAKGMRDTLGVPELPVTPTPKVEANLSGQTDASLEAIRVEKSRKIKGIVMKRVDTRSGKVTPVQGLRPEDNFNPKNSFEILVEVEGEMFKVVARGDKAKPMTNKMMDELVGKGPSKTILRKGKK